MSIPSILSSSVSAFSIYKAFARQPKLRIDSSAELSSYQLYGFRATKNFEKITNVEIVIENIGGIPLRNCILKLERITHTNEYYNPHFKAYFEPFKIAWEKGCYETTLRQDQRETVTFGKIVESKDSLKIITSDKNHTFELPKLADGYYLFIFTLYSEDLRAQKFLARFSVCSMDTCVHFYVHAKEYYSGLEKLLMRI